MRYLVPVPKQFVDFSGVPYSNGTVSVYLHGTQELVNIYKEASSSVLQDNPCVLDSNGAWSAFVPADVSLDYIVQDRDGNVVASFLDIVLPGLNIEGDVTKEYVDLQDGLLDTKIEAETAARAEADANLKDYVDSNVLRIAPPESAGDGEVIFYRGQLLQ